MIGCCRSRARLIRAARAEAALEMGTTQPSKSTLRAAVRFGISVFSWDRTWGSRAEPLSSPTCGEWAQDSIALVCRRCAGYGLEAVSTPAMHHRLRAMAKRATNALSKDALAL